jgi:hypothetical protein
MGLKQKIFHSPGPKWQGGGIFQEQPEDIIKEHMYHSAKFQEQGKLLLDDPFTDIDSSGMMSAADGITRQELEEFATSDRTVSAVLLNFEMKNPAASGLRAEGLLATALRP